MIILFADDIKYCGGNPADLIFVMDSSGSIDPGAFVKQKEFVKAMIDLFDINSGKIRVGVVSYSNWAFLEFHLNTYTTKEEMKNAISNVTHYRGDTNTGSTIGYMRDVMFRAEHGARPDVPRIAIVLTDGRSNDPLYTMKESELTRKAGVTLFAIGVGDDASTYELSRIASNPDKNYVFKVENYDALIKIRELLAIKACGGNFFRCRILFRFTIVECIRKTNRSPIYGQTEAILRSQHYSKLINVGHYY